MKRTRFADQWAALLANRGGAASEEKSGLDIGGNSHHVVFMPTAALELRKKGGGITVVEHYDVAADAKKRISLRNAKTKYFHVKALSNGGYLLEPRVLVPPEAMSGRTLRMLGKSVASLKKGVVSAPIDLAPFLED